MNDKLRLDILNTLVWFDLFSYPLTAEEIWRYLPHKISLLELKESLSFLESSSGYYYLDGKKFLVDERLSRQAGFFLKLKKASRVAKFFSFIPFIEAVFFTNIIGQGNLRVGSDLDFLLLVKPHRLWLARLMAALPFKILGMRPKIENKQDKICLSFYLNADNLDLSEMTLKDDPYFRFWLASLFPLYDPKNIYSALWEANPVIAQHFPNIVFPKSNYICPSTNRPYLNYLDRILGRLQKAFMPQALKEKALINEQTLKLYLVDRRAELAEKYEAKKYV